MSNAPKDIATDLLEYVEKFGDTLGVSAADVALVCRAFLEDQSRLSYVAARYVGGDFESETYPDAVVLHLALPKDSRISADFIATVDRAISAHPPEVSV